MRTKKLNVLILFLLGFLFFTTSFGTVLASDDDSDGIEDEFEDEHKRDVNVDIEDDKIQIESILQSDTGKNKLEFEISNNSDGLSIKVGFIPNYDPLSNTSQIELEFEVTFRKLVEFVDIDSDGIFNYLIDQEVSDLMLDDFKIPEYTIFDISLETQLHYIVFKTSDDVFTAHIYFVEEFDIINNTLITPSETKIDIEINNYNYLNDTSQLALYTKLESEAEYEMEDETEDEKLEYAENENGAYTMINSFIGFFTWTENASIDGVSKNVLVSEITDDDVEPSEQKMYLSYPRGINIYHDPKIGIEGLFSTTTSTSIPGYAVLIIGIASIIGIIGIIYTIKKKQKV
ncbi:MAG: hypothetical protein ACFFEY_11035 [Candidatus Thorarchaeota archaeon]